MEEKVRVHAVINGRVQGVFFRAETRRTANIHGVSGWVRNRPDGTVEAVFEGAREAVQAVLNWCNKGPDYAVVTDVAVSWQEYHGEFDGFKVRY